MCCMQWLVKVYIRWLKPVKLSQRQSAKMGGKFMLEKYENSRNRRYWQEGNPEAFEFLDLMDNEVPFQPIPVYYSYVDKGVMYTDAVEFEVTSSQNEDEDLD